MRRGAARTLLLNMYLPGRAEAGSAPQPLQSPPGPGVAAFCLVVAAGGIEPFPPPRLSLCYPGGAGRRAGKPPRPSLFKAAPTAPVGSRISFFLDAFPGFIAAWRGGGGAAEAGGRRGTRKKARLLRGTGFFFFWCFLSFLLPLKDELTEAVRAPIWGFCAPQLPAPPSSFPADPVGETLFKEGKNQTWGSLGPGVQKGKLGLGWVLSFFPPFVTEVIRSRAEIKLLRIWRPHGLVPNGFVLRVDARFQRWVLVVPSVRLPTSQG